MVPNSVIAVFLFASFFSTVRGVTAEVQTRVGPTAVPEEEIEMSPLKKHSSQPHWSYNDQDAWKNIGECGGKRQSPVDLHDICYESSEMRAQRVNTSLNFVLVNYE